MFINSQFLYLWTAQTLSQLATNILVFLISFFVYKQTSSNTAVSFALLAFLVPSFVSSIIAGIIVERMGKRWVLFAANIGRALIVGVMFFAEKSLWILYLLIGLLAFATQFFTPAESTIIPRVVPQKKLMTANAYFSITIYLTLIVGFLVSPIFFKIIGYKTLLIIFFAYIASAIVLYLLKIDEPVFYTNFKQPVSILVHKFHRNLTATFKSFFENSQVNTSVFSIIIVQAVLFVLIALAPGFADKILKIPVEDLSFLIVFPTALGFVFSALIVSHSPLKERVTVQYSFLALALTFFSIFVISQFHTRALFNILNFLLLMLVGFFSGFIMIMSYTQLQKDGAGAGKAGYFGILNAMINLASVIPVMLSGFLSDVFGVDKIVFVIAFSFLILFVFYKKYREL